MVIHVGFWMNFLPLKNGGPNESRILYQLAKGPNNWTARMGEGVKQGNCIQSSSAGSLRFSLIDACSEPILKLHPLPSLPSDAAPLPSSPDKDQGPSISSAWNGGEGRSQQLHLGNTAVFFHGSPFR